MAVFRHDHEVFTIKWSPAPPAGGQGQLLATTSLDKTVRLFDTQSGRWGACVCVCVGGGGDRVVAPAGERRLLVSF